MTNSPATPASGYQIGKPITIDDFVRVCGHFDPDHDDSHGYGCAHPENDNEGRCYTFACPLASEMEADDAGDVDALAKLWGGEAEEARESIEGGDWLMPWR